MLASSATLTSFLFADSCGTKNELTHKKKAAHCGYRIVAIIFDEALLAELTNGQLPFLTRLLKGFNGYIYSSNFPFSISFRVGISVHSLVLKGRA